MVFGDWGYLSSTNQNLLQSAYSLSQTCQTYYCSSIISVGDNFYPDGLISQNDEKIENYYLHVFNYSSLQIPFYSVLGNHDYHFSKSPQYEIELTKTDPTSRWHCPSRYFIIQKTLNFVNLNLIFIDTVNFRGQYSN